MRSHVSLSYCCYCFAKVFRSSLKPFFFNRNAQAYKSSPFLAHASLKPFFYCCNAQAYKSSPFLADAHSHRPCSLVFPQVIAGGERVVY